MWHMLTIGFMTLFFSGLAIAENKITPEPKNLSAIKVTKGPFLVPKGSLSPLNVDKCSGTLDTFGSLSKVRLSKELLLEGAFCNTGDFDGNGSVDFALWGALYSPDPRYAETRDHLVLFFDGKKLIEETIIQKHDTLLKFGPAKELGPYGEPKTELPGLIAYGEGGPTHIYLWNPKTKKFVHSEYRSEDGSD